MHGRYKVTLNTRHLRHKNKFEYQPVFTLFSQLIFGICHIPHYGKVSTPHPLNQLIVLPGLITQSNSWCGKFRN